MKKIISIIALLVLCTSALAGCVSTDSESVNAKVDSSSSAGDSKAEPPQDDSKAEETQAETEAEKQVEEQILWEYDGVKVTLKGVEKNDGFMGGYEVKFAIESTSANNYKLSIDSFSINDYSISTFLYTEILAGKKANDSISIYKSTLEENDIDRIEKLEFILELMNSDTYDSVKSETINISLG